MLLKNCSTWVKDQIINSHILINEETGKIDRVAVSDTFGLSQIRPQIDMERKLVIPSLIDIHSHLRDFEEKYKETYATAAVAAAAGGFTTVFDMPNKINPINNSKRLEEVLKRAKDIAQVEIIPYILLDRNTELDVMKNQSYFKAYLGPTTGSYITDIDHIKEFLAMAPESILSVHCEDASRIEANMQKYPDTLNNHPLIRDTLVELNSISDLIAKIKNQYTRCKVHIAHITLQESLYQLHMNKLSFEVTPHHLFLNQDDFIRLGVKAKMSPPLRSEKEQLKLWNSFLTGKIPIIATDHAPHNLEEKFEKGLNGVPGLETCLSLLIDHCNPLTERKLQLIVNALARNPRKLMKFPDEGIIAKGEPANLAIVDLKKRKKIIAEDLKTKCKWSPWEGEELTGWPVMTIRNGKIVYES